MRPPTVAVHHLALLVHDLARATAFYTEILGLPVLRRWPDATGATDRSVWLELGDGAFLALERAPTPTPDDTAPASRTATPARAGYHLLALRITADEREPWRERLTRSGHPVTHETDYTLYVLDPEGNRVALSHWPEPAHSASG